MGWSWVGGRVVVIGLLAGPCCAHLTPLLAQDPPIAPAKAQTADRKAQLAERDRLWIQSQETEAAGQIAAAIEAVQQVLAIEQQVLGGDDLKLAGTHERLVQLHLKADAFDAAAAAAAEVMRLKALNLGKEHWQVTDARWLARDVEIDRGLTPPERRELHASYSATSRLMKLYREGRHAEAVAVAEAIVSLRRLLLGEEHPAYAASLDNLAGLYVSLRDYARAAPLNQQALAIQKKVLGEEHPAYATSLSNLAWLYQSRGDYARAESLIQQALAIRKKALGEEHRDYAASLNSLAFLYQSRGDYARAEPLFQQALSIKKKVLGEEHPAYAESLNSLAGLYQSLGDYARAESLYQQALAITKRVLGEEHPDYATILNNLALLYRSLGDYARAMPLYQQALAICKKVLGEEHSAYAQSLSNLAALYESLGDYARAVSLFQRALAIQKKVLGEEHLAYAESLNNLAALYQSLGDYARAEPLYQQALAITKKVLGEEHPDCATILSNLAGLYVSLRDYARAPPLYQQALAIKKKVLGEEHSDYARILDNIAGLYELVHDYALAEQLYQRALAILKKVLGEEHPYYAESLNNLALLYRSQGDYARAEPLCRQAVAIRKKALGEEHRDYASSLENLGALLATQGDIASALALLEQADRIEQANLRNVFAGAGEATMRAFLAKQGGADWLITLVGLAPAQAAARTAAYDAVLSRKTAIFDALLRLRQFERLAADNPDLRDKAFLLRARQQQLANMAFQPATPESQKLREQRTAEVHDIQSELNRALNDAYGAGPTGEIDKLDVVAVARRLPAATALVEMVRYTPYDFKATGQAPRWLPARYAALVLRSGDEPDLQLVDLGPAEAIDGLVAKLRAEVARELALSSEEDLEGRYRKAAGRLSQAVFIPLQAALEGATQLFLAPDGELTRISWEALVDADGRYLIETRSISYLSSGADLLREAALPATGAVVFAAPDYQLDGQPLEPSPEILAQLRGGPDAAFGGDVSLEVRGLNWAPLPATVAEAKQIEELLRGSEIYDPVVELLGPAALEGALKRMRAPRLLHLATHGFYLPDQPREPVDAAGVGDTRGGLTAAKGLALLKHVENPLLRSGIILAGANRKQDDGDVAGEHPADDGWVTAEEIGLLDLSGTELVVLSACETGLGDVRTGEGVSGLRRAFIYAGARTLVTSLYKVPDGATQELMTEFYRRLATGAGKHEALRQAELAMIAKRRNEHGAAHPFFWASFILVGDPN